MHKDPYLKSSDALIPTNKRNKKEWKSCLKCPQNGEKVMMDCIGKAIPVQACTPIAINKEAQPNAST